MSEAVPLLGYRDCKGSGVGVTWDSEWRQEERLVFCSRTSGCTCLKPFLKHMGEMKDPSCGQLGYACYGVRRFSSRGARWRELPGLPWAGHGGAGMAGLPH